MPEDSDDDDPDEVFGFITMLNLTERKVTCDACQQKQEKIILDNRKRKNATTDLLTGRAVRGGGEGAALGSLREKRHAQHDGAAGEDPG